ncbi:MAG: hypothetical protein KF795_00175 [Labilithrix sp.]|nr:hypothetical protein [Labilithrix sp.]
MTVAAKNRGLRVRPPPGTRVRFTGYFLAATGQHRGGEGGKRFTVVACSCGCETGDVVAVDEPLDTSSGYDDIPPERRPRWRHIALGNLEIVGGSPK